MIVLNANAGSKYIYFLPNLSIAEGVTEFTNLKIELIDDETQGLITITGGDFEVDADFVKYDLTKNWDQIKIEKFYTMRVKQTSNDFVVYRDKIYKTTQVSNKKYDNNVDQYVFSDSGNNDYITI